MIESLENINTYVGKCMDWDLGCLHINHSFDGYTSIQPAIRQADIEIQEKLSRMLRLVQDLEEINHNNRESLSKLEDLRDMINQF